MYSLVHLHIQQYIKLYNLQKVVEQFDILHQYIMSLDQSNQFIDCKIGHMYNLDHVNIQLCKEQCKLVWVGQQRHIIHSNTRSQGLYKVELCCKQIFKEHKNNPAIALIQVDKAKCIIYQRKYHLYKNIKQRKVSLDCIFESYKYYQRNFHSCKSFRMDRQYQHMCRLQFPQQHHRCSCILGIDKQHQEIFRFLTIHNKQGCLKLMMGSSISGIQDQYKSQNIQQWLGNHMLKGNYKYLISRLLCLCFCMLSTQSQKK